MLDKSVSFLPHSTKLTSSPLKDGDFFSKRRTFPPDTENVQGRVHISIVRGSAVRTNPMSYSKRTHAFRTAVGNSPAARARLGSPSFVNFDKACSVPAGLVAEHAAECRPACVEHRLGHPCSCLPCFADDDQFVCTNNLSGDFMQVVASSIGDLRMDRGNSALIASALSLAHHSRSASSI